jgi:hypothetical protein
MLLAVTGSREKFETSSHKIYISKKYLPLMCAVSHPCSFTLLSSSYTGLYLQSRNTEAGVATRLRAGLSGVRIPVGTRDFSPKRPNWVSRHAQPPVQSVPQFLPDGKAAGS